MTGMEASFGYDFETSFGLPPRPAVGLPPRWYSGMRGLCCGDIRLYISWMLGLRPGHGCGWLQYQAWI